MFWASWDFARSFRLCRTWIGVDRGGVVIVQLSFKARYLLSLIIFEKYLNENRIHTFTPGFYSYIIAYFQFWPDAYSSP